MRTTTLLTVNHMQCSDDRRGISNLFFFLSVELFIESVDEFTGIDFLAELDKDEKMYLDGEL